MRLMFYDFLKKLLMFTMILALAGYLIFIWLPKDYLTPTLPYLYVFFMSVSILVHYILLKVSNKRASNFINIFMLLTFGKLIFFLSIILAYSFIFRDDAPQFIISFFILYVFFSGFEVRSSLLHAKRSNQSESGKDDHAKAKV